MGMLNLILNIDVFILVDLSNFYKIIYYKKNNFDIFLCFLILKINILEFE